MEVLAGGGFARILDDLAESRSCAAGLAAEVDRCRREREVMGSLAAGTSIAREARANLEVVLCRLVDPEERGELRRAAELALQAVAADARRERGGDASSEGAALGGSPTAMGRLEVVQACRNVEYDLTCGLCASAFYEGVSSLGCRDHDPSCLTNRAFITWRGRVDRLPAVGSRVWVQLGPGAWTVRTVDQTVEADAYSAFYAAGDYSHEYALVDEHATWTYDYFGTNGRSSGLPEPGREVWVRSSAGGWCRDVVAPPKRGQPACSFCVVDDVRHPEDFYWADRRLTWLERDPGSSSAETRACERAREICERLRRGKPIR